MFISITYPPDFPLTGWEKEVFHFRLLDAMNGRYFNAYSVDNARKSRSLLDSDNGAELCNELSDLHRIPYSKMSASMRPLLPGKLSDYVGVDVRWRTGAGLIRRLLSVLGALSLIAGGAIFGGAGATIYSGAKPELLGGRILPYHQTNLATQGERQPASNVSLSEPDAVSTPQPAWPSHPDVDDGAVMNVSVLTSVPAKAIRRFADSIDNDGKRYVVKVVVTPVRLQDQQ